jgi:hypothetical protein
MLRTLVVVFFFLLFLPGLNAQVFPNEGSRLNYRVIGFTLPGWAKTGSYKLEIATGIHYELQSFKRNTITTVPFNGNKVIAEVPSFGQTYTWRVAGIGSNGKKNAGEFHHFSTTNNLLVDARNTRLRIIDSARKFSDAYVFADGNRALYDMNGKAVWYLPESDSLLKNIPYVIDLKITPHGTITFLAAGSAFEINYNGDVLWHQQADSSGSHHHEFTKLENYHYMTLGNEMKWCRSPSLSNSHLPVFNDTMQQSTGNSEYVRMPFGTLVEYDKHGNIVWKWESARYYAESDLVYYRPPNGSTIIDLHENAFFFDQKDSFIYLSFRNISRVIKIKYPQGAVIEEYGEKYGPENVATGNQLFCNQHACKYSSLGCLFLFNNNGCNRGNPPKIKKFKEPVSQSGGLEKIWEYDCTVEGNYRKDAPAGGNVIELPDHAIFVSMGGEYSKIFIIGDDKKILWSALPEQWVPDRNTWLPIIQYRASIVENRKSLEKLIWNDESKDH